MCRIQTVSGHVVIGMIPWLFNLLFYSPPRSYPFYLTRSVFYDSNRWVSVRLGLTFGAVYPYLE